MQIRSELAFGLAGLWAALVSTHKCASIARQVTLSRCQPLAALRGMRCEPSSETSPASARDKSRYSYQTAAAAPPILCILVL